MLITEIHHSCERQEIRAFWPHDIAYDSEPDGRRVVDGVESLQRCGAFDRMESGVAQFRGEGGPVGGIILDQEDKPPPGLNSMPLPVVAGHESPRLSSI